MNRRLIVAQCYKGQLSLPFKEGENDCTTFACDVAKLICGIDPMEGHRGAYSTTSGGLRLLRILGYNTMEGFAKKFFQEIPVSMTQAGDWALVEGTIGLSLSVVYGHQVCCKTSTGMGLYPLTSAYKAFHVPSRQKPNSQPTLGSTHA